MIRKQAFAAAAAFLCIVAASPLAAQPAREFLQPAQFQGGDLLPPYEVNTILRSMGMSPLHRPFWRHGRYVVRALDNAGREMRVTVDARSGQVLGLQPVASGDYGPRRDYGARQDYGPGYDRRPDLAPRWGNAAPPSYSPQPQDDDNDMAEEDDARLGALPPADPPRVITAPRSAAPTPRAAATPSAPRTAAATPSVPPLPRPKPAGQQAASNEAAPPQGPVRQIELYKKPDANEAASKDARTESGQPKIDLPPVQPLDDTPSVKPNL